MKLAIGLCGIALGMGLAAAQEPDPGPLIDAFDNHLTKLVALLKGVKDEASAAAAREQLAAQDKGLGEAKTRIEGLVARPGPAAMAKVAAWPKRLDDLDVEIGRVAAIPKANAVLGGLTASQAILKDQREAKVARARVDVQTLTRAAQAYAIKYGQLPDKLETLQAPPVGLPFIEPKKETLLDPWGRQYKYDPAGTRNGGLKPDVWSEGPDPKDTTKVIGNWPAK